MPLFARTLVQIVFLAATLAVFTAYAPRPPTTASSRLAAPRGFLTAGLRRGSPPSSGRT
jgi:hypothetical protein